MLEIKIIILIMIIINLGVSAESLSLELSLLEGRVRGRLGNIGEEGWDVDSLTLGSELFSAQE